MWRGGNREYVITNVIGTIRLLEFCCRVENRVQELPNDVSWQSGPKS